MLLKVPLHTHSSRFWFLDWRLWQMKLHWIWTTSVGSFWVTEGVEGTIYEWNWCNKVSSAYLQCPSSFDEKVPFRTCMLVSPTHTHHDSGAKYCAWLDLLCKIFHNYFIKIKTSNHRLTFRKLKLYNFWWVLCILYSIGSGTGDNQGLLMSDDISQTIPSTFVE